MDGDQSNAVLPDNLTDLLPSFVDCSSEPAKWFTPFAIGHAPTDFQRGVRFAEEAMTFTRTYGSHNLLYFTLSEIASHQTLSALDFGFLDRIAKAASAGSMN